MDIQPIDVSRPADGAPPEPPQQVELPPVPPPEYEPEPSPELPPEQPAPPPEEQEEKPEVFKQVIPVQTPSDDEGGQGS